MKLLIKEGAEITNIKNLHSRILEEDLETKGFRDYFGFYKFKIGDNTYTVNEEYVKELLLTRKQVTQETKDRFPLNSLVWGKNQFNSVYIGHVTNYEVNAFGDELVLLTPLRVSGLPELVGESRMYATEIEMVRAEEMEQIIFAYGMNWVRGNEYALWLHAKNIAPHITNLVEFLKIQKPL